MLRLVTGNIFDANAEALVNTVNTVGAMGRGLALQFKKAFPANNKAYEAACKRGEVQIGRMLVFEAGGIVLPRYIINFPTKRHWRGASRLEYIELGLVDLVRVVRDYSIRSIAIPPLGAGLGRLEWTDVESRIRAAMRDVPDVEVFVYQPASAPPPEHMKNRTERPSMTAGRAAVLTLMHRYLVPGYDYPITLLEVQKLAYFLQAAGVPLRLQYRAHHYGPYADNLRHVLNRIEGHFIEGFGDGENKPTTPLRLKPGAAAEAEAFLAATDDTAEPLARVSRLIEGYETPFGMELLATVHWVAERDQEASDSPEKAVHAVHAWNTRKATAMKETQIRAAWGTLKAQDWLGCARTPCPEG